MEALQQQVNSLKDLLINSVDSSEILTRVSNLETSLIANQAIFSNTGELVAMLDNTNTKINSIISGDSNIIVSYDLDGIRPGEGTFIDRATPNRVRIVNTNQQYNIANGSLTNIVAGSTLTLGTFTNYFVHQNSGTPTILTSDLSLYIDDTTIAWKKGQVLRLVLEDEIIPGIYDLKIYTDALNRNNTGTYGVAIGVYNDLDFTPSLNKPIFDIICFHVFWFILFYLL